MPSLWILAGLIVVPLVLFVGKYLTFHIFLVQIGYKLTSIHIAWLILSSCLGDSFRLRVSGTSINPRQALFDRNYLRTVTSSGVGGWNQIEMEDMLGESPRSSFDSDRR